MALLMPYQCLARSGNLLVAASGPRICLFNLEDGVLLSSSACTPLRERKRKEAVESATPEIILGETHNLSADITMADSSPVAKKRRLSESEAGSWKSKPKDEKVKQRQQRPNAMSDDALGRQEAPAVTTMAMTENGRHVIAVTGEDKSIRVFENICVEGARALQQISLRTMPKRPCSVAISFDGCTIISADKFGDVYSLPLLLSETDEAPKSEIQIPEANTARLFVPTANELTIHSQRNRRALANQMRQTNQPSQKPEALFEHSLLLGHVSMLTDISLVALDGRKYIITADRDEHIRISRGIPQAHIIENFCLGHTDFVSRICISNQRPQVLISGGGDDELFVWDWRAGKILSKVNLKDHVRDLRYETKSGLDVHSLKEPAVGSFGGSNGHGFKIDAESINQENSAENMIADSNKKAKIGHIVDEPNRIAVSGIYTTQTGVDQQEILIVTCEGVDALFIFRFTSEDILDYLETIRLPGNALAVVTNIASNATDCYNFIVSIDNYHTPGSTTARVELGVHQVLVTHYTKRNGDSDRVNAVQAFSFQNGKFVSTRLPLVQAMIESQKIVEDKGMDDRLAGLLYNLENLRKREGDTQEE